MSHERRHAAVTSLRGLWCAALSSLALGAAAAAPPPAAPSVPASDLIQGVRVADPYRNLEDLKAPQTLGWLNAQGEHAAEQLARIEGRDAMARRIEALAKASGDTVRDIVRLPGDRVFYLKRRVGDSQPKLMMKVGLDGAERMLVDPQPMALATGVPHAINYFAPSWDGRTLAYGVSAGGSENASLYLIDVGSGKSLRAPIPRVLNEAVRWAPDNRHLAFNQVRELAAGAPPAETYLDSTVFVIDVRGSDAAPRPLFGPLVDKSLGLDRLDFGELIFAPDSRWMVARTTDTTAPEGKLFVAPVSALRETAVTWRPISTAADKITDVQLSGDTLYLRSYAGAPRGRVLALALADPVLARAKVVAPQPESGVLRGFGLGAGALYAEIQRGFNTRVHRFEGTPAAGTDIAPGLAGSTFLVADPAHAYAEPWVSTSTWTAPSQVLAIARDGGARDTGLRSNRLPPGAPELAVSEVLVPSHDGAGVPLAILRRKGLALTRDNPTLLIGYGAYGLSMEARFNTRAIAWLERGGVLAFANVRGSGAFGDEWHRAGFKATKANTWKDGLACARFLVEQRYTSPKTLGILGGSAGGIFAGRAITSEPAQFAAAVIDVGMMDTVRNELTPNGATNVSEFGSVKNPAEFPALLEMSTYHQIRDDTAYPAVLLIHGLNDPRVDAWHSAKAAARWQAASTSGRPVLLRLDAQAGHGVGSTAQQGDSRLADIYSFLLWQFGKVAQRP